VNSLVAEAQNHFGRIDVLVNNAGIGRVGSIDSEAFEEDLQQTLQASLFGMIHVTRRVLPIFRQQGSGTIVNMSSVVGRKAFPRFGAYAIAMHGVSAFSDSLRQECAGTNIQVSVIHPALTATDLFREADESQMPPQFRHMTPLSSDYVGRAVVKAVYRRQRRLVLPRVADMLLLGDALSPRLGDAIASSLTIRPIAWLLGLSRGKTYHQTVLQRPVNKTF
jgi:NAD(P)-dependent dehydrogenase (short-subunit alcohol dehydrogenase family)